MRTCLAASGLIWVLALGSGDVHAHSGPPFPIVSDKLAGAYKVSVWTDPDATDNGSNGGQFWVMIEMADGSDPPPDTRAEVTIRPLDRSGAALSGRADPVDSDAARQFVALLMDHEGRFDVRTQISGPRGQATVDAWVEATYDLRPPPALLVLYVMPFLAVGVLWLKLLYRRRGIPGDSRP